MAGSELSRRDALRGMNKMTISSKMTSRRMRAMTPKQVEVAAASDPDNLPLSSADLARMKRTPQVRIIRRALGISQEDFASRYHIPLGTLRDWEQGRVAPDQAARAYLTVIARDSEPVRKTFAPAQRPRRLRLLRRPRRRSGLFTSPRHPVAAAGPRAARRDAAWR